MAPYETLYRRKCRTPLNWYKLKDREVLGPKLIKQVEEKVQVIQHSLKVASDRQKSYADHKRKEIEFQVRDKVFLKVSSWKKVLRFGGKGKLIPRYRSDPSHIVAPKEIEVQSDLIYEEESMKILAYEVKQLRNKNIPLVKVLWRNHKVEEGTQEREKDMYKQYPYHFVQ
ncbi:uncharacterized protein LOC120189928 [Hibiscus syriacus]|uniref:uncharacterized protein LOC120189928 n=1 Tax=Hibiscus syriacus TaxID=106335 RepID=UPI001922D841|nr:uncharacterized protein LOC120189928 [Hibiscus syriacus]